MKIRTKVFIIFISMMVVFLVLSGTYAYVQVSNIRNSTLQDTRDILVSEFETAMSAKADVWLTNALQIANNPIISRAMEEGDRQSCIETLARYSRLYKENTTFNNVQVHLIDKEQRSFVKSWDAENFGEKLDYSEAYREVLSTGEPMVTPEFSSKGMRLKGLFPVSINGEVIGLTNFEGGLNSIKRSLKPKEMDFLYFLENEYLEYTPSLEENPSANGFTLSQSDTNEEFLNYVTNRLSWEEVRARDYSFDSEYLTTAVSIERFDGERMGMYILGQKSEIVTESIDEASSLLYTLFLAFMVLLFLLIIVLLLFLNKSLIKPIRVFTGNMEEIAQGDLHVDFGEVERKDEIGQLSRAMGTMQTSLQHKASVIEKFAQGDFSVEVEKVSEKDQLGESLFAMKEAINELLGQINLAVEQVNSGADQVSQASQDLSQGATEQASSLEEITSSTNEIHSQSRQNSENATEALGLAKQASKDAEKGNKQMEELSEVMERINASSDEISKVVKVIDDIAFQINLLALNANVEAARAGKYGKGFAVVADEVRNLAVRSADSVKDTTQMVEETVNNIRQGTDAAEATAKQLSSIVNGSGKVADFLEEIAQASREQAQALEQITEGLDQIDETTQASTASSEESASASEELAGQAQQLRSMVAKFKLSKRYSGGGQQDPGESAGITPKK
ncbi:MAG: methyl-accepting chemotaxis protein [Spirochaetaceae bacterium]